MKKSTKQLIITAIVLIIILVVVIFLGFKVMTTKPLETSEESTTDFSEDYVKYAKGIIDLVGQERDSNHVYGWGKYCNRTDGGQYNCELELIQYAYSYGDETYYASYRYMMSQIWARFHYYRVTGDKSEYEKLKEDINALIAIIDSNFWNLQTNRFLCLYMPDLVESNLIEAEYKEKLFKICFANDHERYPESIVGYSQNNHRTYRFTDLDDYGENISNFFEISITYDLAERYHDENKLTYYDCNEVINQIDQLLQQWLVNPNFKTEMNFINVHNIQSFVGRELMAAIDITAKIKLLELKNDQIEKEKVELDYLLFTWETLNWYLNQSANLSPSDICLMKENIRYFLNHYSQDQMNKNQQAQILNNFIFEINIPYTNYCLLAGKLINQKEIDTIQLFTDLQAFNLTHNHNEWQNGYLRKYNSGYFQYEFNHDHNSVLAGLLLLESVGYEK